MGCARELESALKAFRSALRDAGNVLEHQAQREQHYQLPDISVQTVPLPDCPSTVSSQFGYNPLTMFHKAFVTVQHHEEQGDAFTGMMSLGSERTVSSVLLYNMGLSFHAEGLRKGNTAAMSRAFEFYRHSMMLLGREDRPERRTGPLLLLAALANNMAHVSACFFRHDRTRASLAIVHSLVDEAAMDEFFHGMEDDDIDVFSMNCVYFSETSELALLSAAA